MSRPTGVVPIIATLDDYPGALWPGQVGTPPTKVILTGGEKLTGFVPESPVFPDKLNSILNDFGQRLNDIDLARVVSWPEPGHDVGSISYGSGSNTGALGWCPWKQDRRMFHAGGDKIQESTDGGYTWASAFAPSGAIFFDAANLNTSSGSCHEIAGGGLYAKNGPISLSGWGEFALTAATKARVIRADIYNHCYVIGGERSGPLAGIWTISDVNGEVPGIETTQHPASSNSQIETMAISPGLCLASYTDPAFTTPVVLGWTFGDTVSIPLVSGSPAAIPEVYDLLWCPNEERFIAVCMTTAANTNATIWISTDGISWTHISTLTGCRVYRNSACVDGSIVTIPCVRPAVSSSDLYLCVSSDAGASFDLIPDPLKRHTITSPSFNTSIRRIGNRLGACRYIGSGTVQNAYSFKSGAFERQ